jgi:tRNA nucleotidyltransferase (CCA-adding enzyme)
MAVPKMKTKKKKQAKGKEGRKRLAKRAAKGKATRTAKKPADKKNRVKKTGNKIKVKKISTSKAKAGRAKINKAKINKNSNAESMKGTGINALIEEQKNLTRPDQKVLLSINSFVERLNKELKKSRVNAKATLGGSVAKGTFIRDGFDADIFVKFSQAYRGSNISDLLEGVLKNMGLNAAKLHGSRDYFQVKEGFTYELVPVLDVKNCREAENVADMSPLHVGYFLKKAKANKGLRDEVRITKVYMKSARVYGAESYIKGFSGHVVDLLLIKYGTFLDLAKAAAKWKDEVIIDLEKHHADAKMALNTSKTYGPLIIVDPVQRNRNAAAAVSKECFDAFRARCAAFLARPDAEFFKLPDFSRIIKEKILATRNADVFLLSIAPLEGKRDVVGSKVLKIKEYIEQQAAENEFALLWSDWEFNEKESRLCLAFEDKKLPDTRIIKGPPLSMEDAVERFRLAHGNTYNEKGNIYALETRRFLLAKTLLAALAADEYVREKCRGISFEEIGRK